MRAITRKASERALVDHEGGELDRRVHRAHHGRALPPARGVQVFRVGHQDRVDLGVGEVFGHVGFARHHVGVRAIPLGSVLAKVVAGPDLYTFSAAHKDLITDGLHFSYDAKNMVLGKRIVEEPRTR